MPFSSGLLQALNKTIGADGVTGQDAESGHSALNFDSFVKQSFESASAQDGEFKEMIARLSNSEFTGDPQTLYQLQNTLGEYNNYVSLVSTLVRKGVSSIETLVKAQ